MALPYEDLRDSGPWSLMDVADLWTFLSTLWPHLSIVAGHEQAAGRTWAAMLADVTPFEAGRAAWNLAAAGADRCPTVGVLAAAAGAEAAADRPLRHPKPLTDDQLKIRAFLDGILEGHDAALYEDDRFRMLRVHLDDYAAGRMALCPTIHAELDAAGLLPDAWRTVPTVTVR